MFSLTDLCAGWLIYKLLKLRRVKGAKGTRFMAMAVQPISVDHLHKGKCRIDRLFITPWLCLFHEYQEEQSCCLDPWNCHSCKTLSRRLRHHCTNINGST